MQKYNTPVVRVIVGTGVILLALAGGAEAQTKVPSGRETQIRAGYGQSIVAVHPNPASREARAARADVFYPFPRPRLAGFSPQIAIATSDENRPPDFEFEHDLESSYVGLPLNAPANRNFVIGFLDSGASFDLAAGTYANTLGLRGVYLTGNTVTIGGVGGEVAGTITYPIGYFIAGLSAVDATGALNLNAVVGHSNVSMVVAPEIDCGNGEVLSAVAGLPLMAFYNSIIRVDTPRRATVGGVTYSGPDIELRQPGVPLPVFARKIALEFGGLAPATTANYYLFPDPFDPDTFEEPLIPTLLSTIPGSPPLGGAFFATLLVIEGEAGPTNPVQEMRVLVDTGAQSSIMSEAMAANLSLPFEPDFTVDVCGVGGLVTGVPGYFVDYVKMNARGGALEFSRAPFVVLDLPAVEGTALDGVLGMNFFWDRNVIFEPSLDASGFFHVSEALPIAYGDSDVDLDVDDADSAFFMTCFTGADAVVMGPDCDHLDLDEDGDVDLTDFAWLQACFSGADLAAEPFCGY